MRAAPAFQRVPSAELRKLRRAVILFPVAIALRLGACAKGPRTTGSITAGVDRPLSQEEIEKASHHWGQRYASNPKDKVAALNYAAAFGGPGGPDRRSPSSKRR